MAARLLFVLNALTVAGVPAFALAGSFPVMLGALWFASLSRKLFYLLYVRWLNQGSTPASGQPSSRLQPSELTG